MASTAQPTTGLTRSLNSGTPTHRVERSGSDSAGREVTKCDHIKNLKTALVILAVVGLVVGLIGMLAQMGILNVGLNGVGALTDMNALYTMIGGFGLTLVSSVIFGVLCAKANCKKATTEGTDSSERQPLVNSNPQNLSEGQLDS